jgi:hypothetical protein
LSDVRYLPASESLKKRSLGTIFDSIHNMKNVNEFMLMTINRCIDFTEVCFALPHLLVPFDLILFRPCHFFADETSNFAEAINLPLRCMRDMQHDGKIVINLTSITKNITENISSGCRRTSCVC